MCFSTLGKQDYKKTRPMLRATRLKAEAKKTALGVKVEIYLIAYTTFVYMLFLFPTDVLCEY